MIQDPPSRILIVDSDRAAAELLSDLLVQSGNQIEISHTAEDGYAKAVRQPPRLAILDVVLPGMDGLALCRKLRQTPATQGISILILTSRGDISDKIAGFEAGADDYLVKPFASAELLYRVKNLLARVQVPTIPIPEKRGQVMAIFGLKGGVGKTTIAVNLALAMQMKKVGRVALCDADYFFGDVAVHLNLPPIHGIVDLVKQQGTLDSDLVNQVMTRHPSGMFVLLGPFRPELAEQITADHVKRLLEILPKLYDFVIMDCQPTYDERMLTILDHADHILLIVTPEVGPIKNLSLFLDLSNQLGITENKIHIALNRANSEVGLSFADVERALRHPIAFRLVSGGRPVVWSANRGTPIVASQPTHPFAQQIMQMADAIIKQTWKV